MMNTHSDGVQTMVDRVVNSDLGANFKYCSDTNMVFSC